MKLVFQPTLFDLQGMLGDRTYIDFVWLWRDREHENMSRERLERWRGKIPSRNQEFANEVVVQPTLPGAENVAALGPSLVSSLPVKPWTGQNPDVSGTNAAPVPPAVTPFPAVLEYPPRPRSRRRAGGPF